MDRSLTSIEIRTTIETIITVIRIKITTGTEIATENRTTIEKENAPQMMT